MKRFIAHFLSIILCFSSISVSANNNIIFGVRESNTLLEFPMREEFVMKDGTVVLEAEDMNIGGNELKVVADSLASGGKAVYIPQIAYAGTRSAIDSPELFAEFLPDSAGDYHIWARVRRQSDAADVSGWVNTNIESAWEIFRGDTEDGIEDYTWKKVSKYFWRIDDEVHEFWFHHRGRNYYIDKFVITRDLQYAPLGKDDAPEPIEKNGEDFQAYPTIYPAANQHPRVYFNKEDIPYLIEKFQHPLYINVWNNIIRQSQTTLSCKLKSGINNWNNGLLDKIQMRALAYALGQADAANAKQTVSYLRDYLDTIQYSTDRRDQTYEERSRGYNIWTIGMVYDWCFDVLTEEDKKYLNQKFYEYADLHAYEWPPHQMSPMSGHGSEDGLVRDYFTAGIAMFDEYPEIYNLIIEHISNHYFDFMKTWLGSGAYQNGLFYSYYRYTPAMHFSQLCAAMGHPDIFGDDFYGLQRYVMYSKLPIGRWFKDSDGGWRGSGAVINSYSTLFMKTMGGAAAAGDPYANRTYLAEMAINNYTNVNIFDAFMFDPNQSEMKSTDELPLTYMATYPFTTMVARTNWLEGHKSNAAMAMFSMRDVHLGDHDHLDSGGFQIWYKGMLAQNTGQDGATFWGSDGFFNYTYRSVAHNVMLVYDPDEEFYRNKRAKGRFYINDGGQHWLQEYEDNGTSGALNNYQDLLIGKAKRVNQKSYFIGPNEQTPVFSYISGDLTPSYTDKISDYDRSMVFIDMFNDDYPAAIVVHDRLTSSNKDFKKTWLLHSELEPVVNENVTTISRTDYTFDGKLVNKTILPKEYVIEKVGGEGKEAWAGYGEEAANWDTNPHSGVENAVEDLGNWRIELSPKNASNKDNFLNAMYVTDHSKNLPQLEMTEISNDVFDGVMIRDRVVTFGKEYDFINDTFEFTVPDNGFDKIMFLICDIEPGMWEITNGNTTIFVESTEGHNCLSFEGSPGNYTIKKAEEGAVATEISYPEAVKPKIGDFLVYQTDLKRMVYPTSPTKLIDGEAYIPVEMIPEFDSTFEVSGDTVTLKRKDKITLTVGSTSALVNDTPIAISYPPVRLNDTIYVAFKTFDDVLKLDARYDDLAKIVTVRTLSADLSGTDALGVPFEYEKVSPVFVDASTNDGNVEANTIDENFETRWSAEGTEQYLIYDFGAEYSFSKVMLAFYSGKKRSTFFEILVSTDGKTYTEVYKGQSSGKSEELETFNLEGGPHKARYIKINCHGTNLPNVLWNSITEAVFIK